MASGAPWGAKEICGGKRVLRLCKEGGDTASLGEESFVKLLFASV